MAKGDGNQSVMAHDWEIIADHLSKAGWNCGCISSTDHEGRQFWIFAAERNDAGRFIVRSDQKLNGFLELETAIRQRCVKAGTGEHDRDSTKSAGFIVFFRISSKKVLTLSVVSWQSRIRAKSVGRLPRESCT